MERTSWVGDPARDDDLQDTLRHVERLVAQEVDGQRVFDGVVEALGRLVDADAAWLIHFDSSSYLTILGVWSTRELSLPVGTRQAISDELRSLRETGQPYRVDLADVDPESSFAEEAHRLGIVSAVGVPVRLAGQIWALAVVARFGPESFPGDTETRMARLIEPVTAALGNAWTMARLEEWRAEQAALRRVAELAVPPSRPDELLRAVVAEAAALLRGRTVILARLENDRSDGVVLAASDDQAPVGLRFSAAGGSALARALGSGIPERIDDFLRAQDDPVLAELEVRAVVAIPVEVEGQLWGTLAAVSTDEPLPVGTESRLSHFAEIAAAAIASAATREKLQRLAEEQAALLRVAQLVARGVAEDELFNAVAVEAGGLIGAGTTLVRFDGPRTYTGIAASDGRAGLGLSVEVPHDDPGIVGEVIRTHRPARRDDRTIRAVPFLVEGEFSTGSQVIVPIIVEGQLWGLLSGLTRGHRLPPGTDARLQQFADLVAAAIANRQARSEIQLLADEQAALLRVAQLVAHGAREEDLFDAVTAEAAGLIDNEATTLIRHDGGRTFTVLATRRGPAEAGTIFTVPADDVGTISEMLRTGRAARIDTDEVAPHWTFTQRAYKVRSSVSVPIFVEGELWGSLGTLTALTRTPRRLPPHTEARLQKFADLVGAAIANRLARTEMVQLAAEQSALRRVAELVARGASLPEVFAGVSVEASRLLAVGTALLRFDPDGHAEIVATHNGTAELGLRISTTDSYIGQMFAASRAGRLADYREAGFAAAVEDLGLEPGTAVPITVEGKIWGALKTSPSGAALRPGAGKGRAVRVADKLDKFATLAAAAIANAENRAQLTASRARIAATANETRRRLQRDVHDGAQQRLVQTVLTLKLARDVAATGRPTDELIEEALGQAQRATAELRDFAHGILPASLSRGGLRSGIESLIADLPVPVLLDYAAPRLPTSTEITAYFIVAEALTNVVKHAAAAHAFVRIGDGPGRLTIDVRDDGAGGADPARGSGLTGLMDRVEAAEGELVITSPPGGGTTVHASLPVEGLSGP